MLVKTSAHSSTWFFLMGSTTTFLSDALLIDLESDEDDPHDELPALEDDDEPVSKPQRKNKAERGADDGMMIEPDRQNFGGKDEGENEF